MAIYSFFLFFLLRCNIREKEDINVKWNSSFVDHFRNSACL